VDLPFAFYGRVSTEDNQDPQASRAWQTDKALRHITAHEGVIVANYFDLGVSRRYPWPKRPEASRLLTDLKNPTRGWADIVVGEPQRACQGSQYETVAPVLKHYGVRLWMPGVSDGPIDFDNSTQDFMMAILGQMSKSERKMVQQRVKDAMRSLAALGDGRHMGGRPPYGYMLVDAGKHPNPSKAKDGRKLHRLEPDPITAPAVAMIFDLWIGGRSYGEIAQTLDERGFPSPSSHDPARNTHRAKGPWARSAVRAILTNPRYTGYQVWGRQPASYELLDPENPGEGDEKVQRWADPSTWTRSTTTAHEALVTDAQFGAAQARLTTKGPHSSRKERVSKYVYLFKSRITCGSCQRHLEGSQNNGLSHYRCRLVGVSNAANIPADHPRSVYLREDRMVRLLDQWMTTALSPEALDVTVTDLLNEAARSEDGQEILALRQDVADAQRLLNRYKAVLDADPGDDLMEVIRWIKEAQGKRSAAEHRLNLLLRQPRLDEATLRAMIAEVPDMRALLALATDEERRVIYKSMDLRCTYQIHTRTMLVEVNAAALAWGYQQCPRGDLNPHSP